MATVMFILVGCVSNPWDDFAQIQNAEPPTKAETYADLITLVSDDSLPPTASDEPLEEFIEEEPTPHEVWLMQKAEWEEIQNAIVALDPTYEPVEFPTKDPDIMVEEVVVEEKAVEEIPVKEPNVHIDSPIEAFTKEDRARSVNVADTEVPDWFVWICAVLILATLISLCYIAKQRKEAHWYKRRGGE